MLDELGRFQFTDEVLDLVERLWCAFQQAKGRPEDEAGQLAGLIYIVAILRQDVEAVWSLLTAAPRAAGVDWEALVAEELGELDSGGAGALRAELQRRGWVG